MSATLLTALLTSITPILQARRTDLTGALRSGARQGGRQRSTLRTSLLLIQATFSVVLLIGAGLFVRSLQQVEGMRLGFDTGAPMREIIDPYMLSWQLGAVLFLASLLPALRAVRVSPSQALQSD